MGYDGEVLIRVAAHSDARILARLIAKRLRERGPGALQAIGPSASYEAVRSLIMACLHLLPDCLDLRFVPTQFTVELNGVRPLESG